MTKEKRILKGKASSEKTAIILKKLTDHGYPTVPPKMTWQEQLERLLGMPFSKIEVEAWGHERAHCLPGL